MKHEAEAWAWPLGPQQVLGEQGGASPSQRAGTAPSDVQEELGHRTHGDTSDGPIMLLV